jgi:hypothetical protein
VDAFGLFGLGRYRILEAIDRLSSLQAAGVWEKACVESGADMN